MMIKTGSVLWVGFTWERLKEATVLSSYSRILMVSSAHVLSASRPDFRDIITRQASGVPGIKTVGFLEPGRKKNWQSNVPKMRGTLTKVDGCNFFDKIWLMLCYR